MDIKEFKVAHDNIAKALQRLPPGALAEISVDLAKAIVIALKVIKDKGGSDTLANYMDTITPIVGVGAHILLLDYLLLAIKCHETDVNTRSARPN